VDSRTPFQPPAPAKISPLGSSVPGVIYVDGPKTHVVDVTLPNNPRGSFLNVPGVQVFQSPEMTIRIRRSIFVPGGYAWWSSSREKKVLLGELRSRIDPQTPRLPVEDGSRVSMRAILDKDGRVELLRPVNGSVALISSVTRAIREWRFEPTLMDGKPVETAVLVVVEFHPPIASASKP
jgi:hypothetical protein